MNRVKMEMENRATLNRQLISRAKRLFLVFFTEHLLSLVNLDMPEITMCFSLHWATVQVAFVDCLQQWKGNYLGKDWACGSLET